MKHSVEPVGKDVAMRKVIQLSEICDLQNGYAFKSSDYVDFSNTLNCRMSNIRPEGKFDIDYAPKYLPDSFSEKYAQFILNDGDLVIAMTDMANDPKILGVPTIVNTNGYNVLLNQRVGKLIFKNPNEIDIRYLQYYLNQTQIRKYYTKFAGGGLQLNLGKKEILSVSIPLPPLSEQQRIADLLDAADALRQKDKALLDKYEALGQSLFLELFGDPRINFKKFKKCLVDEIALKVTDGDHATPKRQENGIKLLSCRNVKNGYIDFEVGVDYVGEDEFNRMFKRCNPEKGDILISCSGTIGRTTEIKIDEPFVLVRSAALIKLKKEIINPTYFEHYCRTQYMQSLMLQNANTSSQANLFTGPIKKLPVLIAPLELQNHFASQIALIEQQKAKVKANLAKSEELFKGLLGESFK